MHSARSVLNLAVLFTVVLAGVFSAAPAHAETRSVPDQYPTIQAAIDACVDGDVVIVADGTYTGGGNKDLDFGGRAIVVCSENGPENCVIDCEDSGRAFHFHSGETTASVLDGFTITNGRVAIRGGGIYCVGSSPLIVNCALIGNRAAAGGGMFDESGSRSTLLNCVFQENVAWEGSAGQGGAFHTFGGAGSTLIGCVFYANYALEGGGAIDHENASTIDLTNCVFIGNTSGGLGGAVYHESSGKLTLTNCTFTGNTANTTGGAIHCTGSVPLTVVNSVLWGNVADADGSAGGPFVNEEAQIYDGVPGVSFSCIQGLDVFSGNGNIGDDPAFLRDPDPGPDGAWGTEDDDYGDLHLQSASPCIDAGCNWAVPSDVADLDDDGDTDEITPFDLDGEGRFFDDFDVPDTGCGCAPIIDMGAYEHGGTGEQPCFGDLDCDRAVGLGDLAVLLAHYGESGDCAGDLNCDGDVDLADLSELLAVYGMTCE